MLVHVRTTIRLPHDLYTRVKVMAASQDATVTSVIEDALRSALARHEQAPSRTPYRVAPLQGNGLQPGVDLDDNAALLDLMDTGARS